MAMVEIIAERCKSCGYCVKFCPKKITQIGEKVNSKGYEYAEITNQDDCTACCFCARICPDGAINIYK